MQSHLIALERTGHNVSRAQLTLTDGCALPTRARPLGIASIFDRELPNMVEMFVSILHRKMILKTSPFFPPLGLIKCPNIRHESIHLKNNLKDDFSKNWQCWMAR